MGNEFSRLYELLSYVFIDNNYEIDDTQEWTELIQQYIMRYRRIIGICILIILFGISQTCHYKKSDTNEIQLEMIEHSKNKNHKDNIKQSGGAGAVAAVGAPVVARAIATQAAKQAGTQLIAKEAGQEIAKKAGTELIANQAGKQISKQAGTQLISEEAAQQITGNESTNKIIKQSKIMNSFKNSIDSSQLSKYIKDKREYMETYGKYASAKKLGSYAVDKFKDFAGWLYEILFALAIFIAICMIVVPSIAFVLLGLICYFLLRKKISVVKAY